MKLINKDNLRILEPEKGMFIAPKDRSMVIEGVVYLGIYDSESNYIDVTPEEKVQIEKEIEAKMEQERLDHEAEMTAMHDEHMQ